MKRVCWSVPESFTKAVKTEKATSYREVYGEVRADPKVLNALQKDEVMASLVERFGPYAWTLTPPFHALARAIVGQRISEASAKAVFARLEETGLEPAIVLNTPPADLRNLGLPESKVGYLHNIAVLAGEGGLEGLETLSSDEVVRKLTAVKGIGPWTAHMFLIFSLGRLDVWPTGDLGVVKVAKRLYGVEDKDGLQGLGERFAPYESAAVWYFWQFTLAR